VRRDEESLAAVPPAKPALESWIQERRKKIDAFEKKIIFVLWYRSNYVGRLSRTTELTFLHALIIMVNCAFLKLDFCGCFCGCCFSFCLAAQLAL